MKQETTEYISPFSYIHHKWKVDWKIVPSNEKYDRPNENRSEKEERALEAIASVGVIGGLQLKNLFKIRNPEKMVRRNLLVRHTLWKNNREIPIYTVGKYGANKIVPEYRENYWLEMDEKKVLKCLSFFQFCYLFKGESIEVIPVPEPFTGGIMLNDKPFYVYVERGGIKDLTMFLKWKKHLSESTFILTENLDYIKQVNMFMESSQLKVRVVLDRQLKDRELILYHYDTKTGEWKSG